VFTAKKTGSLILFVNCRGFKTVKHISTVSVAFVLRPYYFSAPCRFTQLHILRYLIFDLTPFGWLHIWTLTEQHGASRGKAGRLGVNCELRQSPWARRLCRPRDLFAFYSNPFCSTYKRHDTTNWRTKRKKHTARNNSNNDVKCGNIYDPWAIKWLCCKACEIKYDYPWQNVRDSEDMQTRPSVTSTVIMNSTAIDKKWTTNDTTANRNFIKPTHVKLARPKPRPNGSTQFLMAVKWPSCKDSGNEFSHPWPRRYWQSTTRDTCAEVVYPWYFCGSFLSVILVRKLFIRDTCAEVVYPWYLCGSCLSVILVCKSFTITSEVT
jgi:hypothetical protein